MELSKKILIIFGGLFELDNKVNEIKKLEDKINDVNFWNDKNEADKVIKKCNDLKSIVVPIEKLKEKVNNNIDIIVDDEEILDLLADELDFIKEELDKIKIFMYLSDEYDRNNCILEIHAGAGGTESCDWAVMLERMYERYCKNKGYEVEKISFTPGDEVGVKSVMIKISGDYAYGYLKGEKGVHRLVRISPFDSNKRRHTSFASVEVVPEINDNIDINLKENELKIDVYRSSGAGGQSVNTTDSAVRVTHLPTGIVVTCQNERSQIQNKQKALEILASKLYLIELDKQKEKIGSLKEGQMSIGFGSGKRSYVMCPYTLVKDNESGYETSNVDAILNGEIDDMILAGIRR